MQRLLTAAYFVDLKLKLLEVNNRLKKQIPVSQMTILGLKDTVRQAGKVFFDCSIIESITNMISQNF